MITSKELKINFNNKIIEYSDFEIERGDFVLIKGRSGSGKSSLIKSISVLNIRYEGSLIFDGKECKFIDEKERSRLLADKISYTAQENDLIEELSVIDNIELGSSVEINREKLLKELKYFELEGYENRKVIELSGGEKKRVSIIKGILSGKEIIIIDEPFVSLGNKYTEKVLERFNKLITLGKTLIISSNILCDLVENSVLIDIDQKKYIRNKYMIFNNNIERKYQSEKKERFSKVFSKRFFNFSSILFCGLFLLMWIKAFEFKTEKYYKDPLNISYAYKGNSVFEKNEINWFMQNGLDLYEFHYDIFYIKNLSVNKYIFNDNFPLLSDRNYKFDKNVCYVSKNLERYCVYIKSKENCKRCEVFYDKFMINEEYLIRFNDSFKPNALFLINGSVNYPEVEKFIDNNFKRSVKLKFWRCEISYYWKYLYPKLKKISSFLNLFFAFFAFFYVYNIFYHKLHFLRILYSNGISLIKLFKIFGKKIIKYFYISYLLSSVVFSLFNLAVRNILPLENLSRVIFYYLYYHLFLISGLLISIYYSLKLKIKYILSKS